MALDGRPPRWTTLLVVAGSLAMVALGLYVLADRDDGRDVGLDAATASPDASATPTGAETPTPTPAATPGETTADLPVPSGSPTPQVPSVSVDVLNQTSVEGLAGRVGAVLSEAGWDVGRIDNATLGAPSSTLYVPAGLEPAAEAFVVQFPPVSRTRPAFEGLAVDALTLVLAQPDADDLVVLLESSAAGVPSPVGTSP